MRRLVKLLMSQLGVKGGGVEVAAVEQTVLLTYRILGNWRRGIDGGELTE